jgi:hypothetical protein
MSFFNATCSADAWTASAAMVIHSAAGWTNGVGPMPGALFIEPAPSTENPLYRWPELNEIDYRM